MEYDSKKVIVNGELNELNTFIISSIRLDNTCEAELELKSAKCENSECEECETVEVAEEIIGAPERAENVEDAPVDKEVEEAPSEEEKKDE